jgi:hypothetical protein
MAADRTPEEKAADSAWARQGNRDSILPEIANVHEAFGSMLHGNLHEWHDSVPADHPYSARPGYREFDEADNHLASAHVNFGKAAGTRSIGAHADALVRAAALINTAAPHPDPELDYSPEMRARAVDLSNQAKSLALKFIGKN